MEPRMGSATESSSSMKREKIQAIKKKPVVRKKREKVPQLNISGSAADWEDFRENLESFSVSNPNGGDSMEPRMGSATESSSSTKREKIQAIKKKPVVRKKREKVPQLNISGSAKRLKIKEKAVLTGVFTKYGVKAALSSREES
ncbi:hypothetical protein L1049_005653 [Liquidambar formosana]|uniref:Uncharacterized protein n=1 Tax=Liquidambar formosana TaxID=63359 RepID=A0AAP0RFP8_LIQFO